MRRRLPDNDRVNAVVKALALESRIAARLLWDVWVKPPWGEWYIVDGYVLRRIAESVAEHVEYEMGWEADVRRERR